jgi:hypothetical protein
MIRKLTDTEKKLLLVMPIVEHRYKEIIENNINRFIVEEMEDGNMGSLAFQPLGNSYNRENYVEIHSKDKSKKMKVYFENRKFEKIISEIETNDSDGIAMSIALYVDNFDNIYELDIWKVNFDRMCNLSVCLDNYTQGNTSGHENFFREAKIRKGKKYSYLYYNNKGDKITCGRILPICEGEDTVESNVIA